MWRVGGKVLCYSLLMEHPVKSYVAITTTANTFSNTPPPPTPASSNIVLSVVIGVVQQTGHCDCLAIWLLEEQQVQVPVDSKTLD